MRAYRQWIVWRYEESEGTKPTKVPYCVKTGYKADVLDSSSWCSFEEAVAILEAKNWYSGLGFVLTEADPFAFIDLDDPNEKKKDGTPKFSNVQEVLDRQLYIFNSFASYAERSPSGKGLHIIVKGSLPSGRRRSAIEVYSNERYMTMTGDVYRNAPIVDCHEALNLLWLQMGGTSAQQSNYEGWPEPKESDEDVFNRALNAANGMKFKDLHDGHWQNYYDSQSEADFAYVDIVAFYTQNRAQIIRMFHNSVLGKREKAKRKDYINYMLNRCFDRILSVDIDGLYNKGQETLAALRKVETKKEDKKEAQNPYTVPPGLLGKIANFIYQAAPRPVPEIALAGAIGLMSGIVGRAYNVSGMGINQYVLLLAATGVGKEAIASGIDRLMNQVTRAVPAAGEFIGPAEVSSPQALTKYLNTTSRSFVCIVGEFGLMLSHLSAEHAPPHLKGLKRMYLDLYNKSGDGKQMRPTIYSDKEKNTSIILSPAVSILGESTPETFYSCLNEGMITEGLLPRITVMEYHGDRPALQESHLKAQPSFELIEQCGTIAAHALQLNSQNKVINVRLDEEADKIAKAFDEHCTLNINNSDREIRRHLWNRAHVKVLKLASLVAVGINPYEPVVDKACIDWAMGIVLADVRNLLGRFDAGEIGVENDEARQINKLVEAMKDYLMRPWSDIEKYKAGTIELHANKVIPHSYIHRRCATIKEFKKDRMGSSFAIKRTITTLIERGDLQQVSRVDLQQKYGTHANCYMVASQRMFGLG